MQTKKIPKVSVCVVTYNQEKYIRQCLQSIVEQETDFPFEVVVGDDGSTDCTTAVIHEFMDKYPKIIKSIFHEKNIGCCKNLLLTHKLARGEYIAHCDGDDYWYSGKLQSQVNFMERNQDCSAVYTNAWVKTDSGDIVGVFSTGVKEFFDIEYLIKKGNFLTHSSVMYCTKFREFIIPTCNDFVDFLIHIRLAQCGRLGFIDSCFVSYTYQSNTSVILNNNNKIRLLVWDALQDISLLKIKRHVVDNAKFYFIADAIIFEIIHGDRLNVSKWFFILSNNLNKNIITLNLKLIFFIFIVISDKVSNRFNNYFNKINTFFYK